MFYLATPHVKTGYANSNVYVLFLTVTGINGLLTGVGVCGGNSRHYVRITIDGQHLVDDFLCASSSGYANNGLGVSLPFDNDLQIEVKDDAPSVMTRFWVTYVTG